MFIYIYLKKYLWEILSESHFDSFWMARARAHRVDPRLTLPMVGWLVMSMSFANSSLPSQPSEACICPIHSFIHVVSEENLVHWSNEILWTELIYRSFVIG